MKRQKRFENNVRRVYHICVANPLAKEQPHCLLYPPSLTIPEACLHVENVAAMLFTQNAAFIAHHLQSSYFSNAAESRLITNLKPEVANRVYWFLHPKGRRHEQRGRRRRRRGGRRGRQRGRIGGRRRGRLWRRDRRERRKWVRGHRVTDLWPPFKFLGEKPWVRGQFQGQTQVIGLSLNALHNNINLFRNKKRIATIQALLLWYVHCYKHYCYPGTVLAYLF